MRIEATAAEIGALLRLAELDALAPSLPTETYRSRRAARCGPVPQALLERYQKLLDGGRRPVLVGTERGCCAGCHVRLPTMLEHEARRSPAVHICPHCHRMLYAPELLRETAPRAPSERKPAMKRASGLAPTRDRSKRP